MEIKKYLSASSIKNTYRKVFNTIKNVVQRDDVRMYSSYTRYILLGIWSIFLAAWNVFTFMLASRLFIQGTSLLIEGKSGTMTFEFEIAWLVAAVKVFLVVLIGGSMVLLIDAIHRFIKARKELNTLLKDKAKLESIGNINKEIRDHMNKLERRESK